MILYDLNCENDHIFEAWFASSEQYEKQNKKKLINCPICNSNKIKKALMAPKLKGAKKRQFMAETVNDLGRGGQRACERQLGWCRNTIRGSPPKPKQMST